MELVFLQNTEGWQAEVQKQGLPFHSLGGKYWVEDYGFVFQRAEIEQIQQATRTLYEMYLEAMAYLVEEPQEEQLIRLDIPSPVIPLIRESWKKKEPSLYGRFDLAYRNGELKLLEFNGDTPTSLIETSITQWYWLTRNKDQLKKKFGNPSASNSPSFENTKEFIFDQFNTVHENLIQIFRQLRANLTLAEPSNTLLHFLCMDQFIEDKKTTEYLADCAEQGGFEVKILAMGDVGWNGKNFTDLENEIIHRAFKLYPWEDLYQDAFFEHVLIQKSNGLSRLGKFPLPIRVC